MTADSGADTGTIAADSDPRVKSVLAAIRGIPDFPKKVLTLFSNHLSCTPLAYSPILILYSARLIHGVPQQGDVSLTAASATKRNISVHDHCRAYTSMTSPRCC